MVLTAFQVAEMPTVEAVRMIRTGLPLGAFHSVARILALSSDQLAEKLGISPRTLRNQRTKSGRLSKENTEKLVRIARVQALAKRILASDDAVSRWLTTPAPALDGTAPLDLLDTETGARDVEGLLNGIAYGNSM